MPAAVLSALTRWSGVTRLADLTDLDFLGLPVMAAIRPSSKSLSLASGKGENLAVAITSAIMEAYEHAAAERAQPPLRMANAQEARSNQDFAAPNSLPADRRAPVRMRDSPIKWVQFERLSGDDPLWLPYDMVHLRLTCQEMTKNDGFLVSTNGLAAAGTFKNAILHGLCEVIERDAIACALDGNGSLRLDLIAPLDITACANEDPCIARIANSLLSSGLEISLNDLTHEIGVPVIHCRLSEISGKRAFVRPCDGVGCATTPKEALQRAIYEAAQARATLISGARDDILNRNYHVAPGDQPERPEPRPWTDIPHGPQETGEALNWALSRLSKAGFPDAAALKLDEQDGAVAVRVVIPGLEGVPMSAGYVPGPRLREDIVRSFTKGPKTRMDTAPSKSVSRRDRPIVFLGPTLPLVEARNIVDAEFYPPAAQGELFRAARERPPAILLIDGTFLSSPTVWHKEILWALSEGVPVLGAASLGALRAAELTAFGMIGVGEVFQDYYSAALRADDLVAVQFAPGELAFTPLTDAAVDIAATLEQAVEKQIIGPMLADRIWALVETTHFSQRRWPDLLRAVVHVLPDQTISSGNLPGQLAQLEAWLPAGKTSVKAKDAEAALAVLKRSMEEGFDRPPPTRFPETLLWSEMVLRETNPFLRDLK